MSNMTLQVRVEKLLSITDIPKTAFCKRIELSPQSLNNWLCGKLKLSEKTLERIEHYVNRFSSVFEEQE